MHAIAPAATLLVVLLPSNVLDSAATATADMIAGLRLAVSGTDAASGLRRGRDRRLGDDLNRWRELGARDRTPAEEREWCLLQWIPDFSPPTAAEQAQALWETRPPGITVNAAANRELWADRGTEDLLEIATRVSCPVRMLFGADDPRPWSASDSLLGVLPNADRIVLEPAGHAPWAEQREAARQAILDALRPAER